MPRIGTQNEQRLIQFQVAVELWLRRKIVCMCTSELNENEVKAWWHLIFHLHGVVMLLEQQEEQENSEKFLEMGFKEEEPKVRLLERYVEGEGMSG